MLIPRRAPPSITHIFPPPCRALPVRLLKLLAVNVICLARRDTLVQGWREAIGKLLEVKVRNALGWYHAQSEIEMPFCAPYHAVTTQVVSLRPACRTTNLHDPLPPPLLLIIQREWDLALAHDMGLRLGVTKTRLRKFKKLVRGRDHRRLVDQPQRSTTLTTLPYWIH